MTTTSGPDEDGWYRMRIEITGPTIAELITERGRIRFAVDGLWARCDDSDPGDE